jgi:hypothetical protein
LNTDLRQKACRYRELARQVMDEAARAKIQRLATEYETAASRLLKKMRPHDPAA